MNSRCNEAERRLGVPIGLGLARGHLNPADLKKLQRGYYEDLGDVTRFNRELRIMYGGRPRDWNESPQTRERNDGIGA